MGEKMTGAEMLQRLKAKAAEKKNNDSLSKSDNKDSEIERKTDPSNAVTVVGDEIDPSNAATVLGDEIATDDNAQKVINQANSKKERLHRKGKDLPKKRYFVSKYKKWNYEAEYEPFQTTDLAYFYKAKCKEDECKYVVKVNVGGYQNEHVDEMLDVIDWDNAPGLMRIYDTGESDIGGGAKQRFYILPDYSDFTNLKEYLMNNDMSRDEIKQFIEDMIKTLKYFHSLRFYHRDIKPENIMYDKKLSYPILVDYGIITRGSNPQIFQGANTIHQGFTPGYAPPEVRIYAGKGNYWARSKSDLFSLGVVIAEIYLNSQEKKQTDTYLRLFDENTMDDQIMCGNIKYPDNLVDDAEVYNLVESLLQYNSEDRADHETIGRWINGEKIKISPRNYQDTKNEFRYHFNQIAYNDPQALARSMVKEWKIAVEESQHNLVDKIHRLSGEYDKLKDTIGSIDRFYDKTKYPNVNNKYNALTAEYIAAIGSVSNENALAFAWNGIIYETASGENDYDLLRKNLYNDAIRGENEFDDLVKTRALKEIFYPEIRFKSVESPEYNAKIEKWEYINKLAEKSVQLAKFYLIEATRSSAEKENNISFVLDEYTDGEKNNYSEYLREIFTPENIDLAMQNIFTDYSNERSPILIFISEYAKNDLFKSLFISLWKRDLDEICKYDIHSGQNEIEKLFTIFKLLGRVYDSTRYGVDIKSVFLETKFSQCMKMYIQCATTWKYVDNNNAKRANELKKQVEEINGKLVNNWNQCCGEKNHGTFCDGVLPNLVECIAAIKSCNEIFVSDEKLVMSGILVSAKHGETEPMDYSAVYSYDEERKTFDKEKNLVCLVDGIKVPYIIAKEIYGQECKLESTNKQAIEESIDVTYGIIKRLYNSFNNKMGANLKSINKYSKSRIMISIFISALVLSTGIVLLIEGFSLFFNKTDILAAYKYLIILFDCFLGFVIVIFCKRDLLDSIYNYRLFNVNKNLYQSYEEIILLKSKIESMKNSKKIIDLNISEKEIISLANKGKGNANAFFEKEHLKYNNCKYKRERSGRLLFVEIIVLSFLLFNVMPVRDMLSARITNNIQQMEKFSEKSNDLTKPMQFVNSSIAKFVLSDTEKIFESQYLEPYNTGSIDEKTYTKQRDSYLAMCRRHNYKLQEQDEYAIENIISSKKAYKKAEKLHKQKMNVEALMEYGKVIKADNNYPHARKVFDEYFHSMQVNIQKYINSDNISAIKNLIKNNETVLLSDVNGDYYTKIYEIVSKNNTIKDIEKELLALVLYQHMDLFVSEGIDRMQINIDNDMTGQYEVLLGKNDEVKQYILNSYTMIEMGESSKEISDKEVVMINSELKLEDLVKKIP